MNAKKLVSFIIPHKGRFDMLKQTLRSIAEQACPLDEIEVIVVSQTPEITNIKLLDSSQLQLKTLLIPESETISTLRNQGAKDSSGRYLAFLDADIFISENWVTSMLNQLHHEDDRVIVSGIQVCDSSAPSLEHIRTCLSSAERDTHVAFLPGCNLFLTRDSFEKTGGFPEHLITCEDYYFTDKATQFGTLYRTSDATYHHLGEDKSFSGMFKKELWRGQSNLQSIQGRRILLREIPSFIIPPGICLTFLAALISLLFQAYPLALLFFLLGMAPFLTYSIRLYRLSRHVVNFGSVLKFYATYFLARAIGTLVGVFKSIGANYK